MVNTDVWTDSERYYFTVYRNSERYEGGIRYVFRDELDEYTFFPYVDGGLNTVPEYLKDRDAFETVNIYLWVEKEKRFAKVLCKWIQAQKKIFITESGFNRYWKQISKGISQERGGEAVDLSLLTSPGRLPFINEKGHIEYRSREVDIEAQRQISKKANAMNDNKIRFVYAQSERIVHDKACRLAEQIPYWDFGALEELQEDWELCERCRRKIYIRQAMYKDRKHFPWYLIFFDKGHVSNTVLERFLHEGRAKLYMPMVDELEVKYKEDAWRIVMNRKDEFVLYHNNYEMLDEKERCITQGFHEQKYSPSYLPGIIGYIEGYDWRKHLGVEAVEDRVIGGNVDNGVEEKLEECAEPVDVSVVETWESSVREPEMEENDRSHAGQKVAWWKRWLEGIRKIGGRKLDAVVAFYPNNVYTKYIHKGGDDMQAQIKSWGNSQGIRIPKEILKGAGISLNDVVEISCSDGVIVLTKSFKHRTLEERAAEYGGQLKLDGEFDWGTPVGREVW